MKKILLSGLVASFTILIIGMIMSIASHFLFPAMSAEYNYSNVFRAMNDPLMALYFFYPFMLGFLLAWAWEKIKPVLKAKNIWARGCNFGASFWLVSLVPGMWITYSSFRVSLTVVLIWSIIGLVQMLGAGLIYAKMNK